MNWLKNDILFTEDRRASTRRPTRRRTGRCRRRSSTCSPQQGSFLPSDVHVPELRQEHAEGLRARRRTPRQQVRRASSRTTRGRASPIRRTFRLSELNLPPNNRFNVGAQLQLRPASSATSRSATPTKRSGRTCSTIRTTARPSRTRSSTPASASSGSTTRSRRRSRSSTSPMRTSSSTCSATSRSVRSSGRSRVQFLRVATVQEVRGQVATRFRRAEGSGRLHE